MIAFGIVALVGFVILLAAFATLVIAFALRRRRGTALALEQTMVLAFLVGLLMVVLLVLDGIVALFAAIASR